MRYERGLALALLLGGSALGHPRAEPSPEPSRWWRANFHAHSARDQVDDDGVESPLSLHREMRKYGFDFSLHTPHSSVNTTSDAIAHFAEQRQREARFDVPGLTIAVGEELTVAAGPNFHSRTRLLGRDAPGNLNHISILGMNEFVPSGTPLGAACTAVHRNGGICIVNHAGPGTMMWEAGLWEAPQHRGLIDALEVYNGQALSAFGIDFEERYRQATSYGGLGLKMAAVTGADTHGPTSVARARGVLSSFGNISKLVTLMIPAPTSQRSELDAATLVKAATANEADIIAAVRARRTVATYALPDFTVECDGLGELRKRETVELHLRLSRPLAEVALYREGVVVQTWHNVSEVSFRETIRRPAAYLFGGRQGRARFLTSAIWYEPPRSPKPSSAPSR